MAHAIIERSGLQAALDGSSHSSCSSRFMALVERLLNLLVWKLAGAN